MDLGCAHYWGVGVPGVWSRGSCRLFAVWMAGCGCGGTVLGTSRPPSLDPPQSPRTRGETCAKAHGFASCCVLLLWRVKESISLVLEGLGVWGKGNHSCEWLCMPQDEQISSDMDKYIARNFDGLLGLYLGLYGRELPATGSRTLRAESLTSRHHERSRIGMLRLLVVRLPVAGSLSADMFI